MSVLVTGAAGFIGKHLVEHLLKENISVSAIDLRPVEASHVLGFQADITSDSSMDVIGDVLKGGDPVKAIVHLAAVASPPEADREPARAWSVNVHGTQNVLRLAHKIACPRVVFFSSAHVYGISPKYMPTDENHPLALLDTYTTTKIIGEQLCRLYYENHGLSYAVLRLWNAYGPGQSPQYFLGKKIAQALEGKLTLRSGSVTKDWIHVSDVVRATVLAIGSDYVGPLNVGTGRETSLQEIVNVLADKFELEVALEMDSSNVGPTRMRCDWTRIGKTLGWSPRVSFEDGLADLVERSRKS